MKGTSLRRVLCLLVLSCGMLPVVSAQQAFPDTVLQKIDQKVTRLMEEGKIPGLSLVVVNGDQQLVRHYGYADLERKKTVTDSTLFEIGSCSKAFTALAVQRLISEGRISPDAPVQQYIPWFKVTYNRKPAIITVRQLLHHTSGIPWHSIAAIPASAAADALEQTVRQVVDMRLEHPPGKKFVYATVNYDILALVIQQVSGQSFETYLQQQVIDKLGLTHTTIGKPRDSINMAVGYKIGFWTPRAYDAPVFRGNYAAGYVIADIRDMAAWLKFQMGYHKTPLYDLAVATHQRDETVLPHDMYGYVYDRLSSYGMGWEISLSGNGEIYHGGLNPNYTTYVAMRSQKRYGVAVLANSNSPSTPLVGYEIMKMMAGETPEKSFDHDPGIDKLFSTIVLVVLFYALVVMAYLTWLVKDIIAKQRRFEGLTARKAGNMLLLLLAMLPFVYGLYALPYAMMRFTWPAIIVWAPLSFQVAMIAISGALVLSYAVFCISLFFPGNNIYKRKAPQILLLSILSGLANMSVIVIITSSFESDMPFRYMLYYYLLTLIVYLTGRRFVQVNLIRITRDLVYELKLQLTERIFSTSYQRFEKIDRGRIYTALNDDIDTIGSSITTFIMLATSLFTAIGAFIYLASIAFWATAITVFIILSLSALYYFVSRSTNIYFEEARDVQNVFMRLIHGMIDGYKEISLHRNKKLEYRNDVGDTAEEYKVKMNKAEIRFVNAFLVGELVLVLLLGVVAFGIPKLFPGIRPYTVMSFVVVLLYLIGPVNEILNAVPSLMRLRVAWKRIRKFRSDIPANMDLQAPAPQLLQQVDSLEAMHVMYQYKSENERHPFMVGPINLKVKAGEIVFLIGGNGSGKTTLAKLLCGLYEPDEGRLLINGTIVGAAELGEYFSAVFSPAHLFDKLYNVGTAERAGEIQRYLRMLDLEEKVTIKDNHYSTVNLSGGQRKRLALLQCYLENGHILLFDEWAADQDPSYRNFFYRVLLPEMKKAGKIVIAITHDDNYFDVADKVYKMNQGKLESYNGDVIFATAPINPFI
ncbi:cyclic peptide transporter [Chitinophaga eiseniae]|uniref:Cyclic peptide transporter n=2 Tax=Chitinophaga eiseniae TaxID=634771 RepID=A0A1T4T5E3_9BACT|nr:cyclic peptide transporter [Chitinophaga eiseniae]